jgi:probable HAF family extracellular repeat protein
VDINNSNEAVGAEILPVTSDYEPAFWKDGKLTILPSPAGYSAGEAEAINDDGDVVGTIGDPSGQGHASLWRDGRFIDINSLLLPETSLFLGEARGINDIGQIVALGRDSAGRWNWYLLTPVTVPEPSTWAIVLAGLGVLGLAARHRRNGGSRPVAAKVVKPRRRSRCVGGGMRP